MNRPADPLTELVLLLTVVLLGAVACLGVSTLPTRDRVRELERRVEVVEQQHAAVMAVAQGKRDAENAERMVRR